MSDVQSAQNADAAPLDAETRARAHGWRPKDEYKGPADKWRDAEDYLAVADEVLPVAIQSNRKLEEKFAKQEAAMRTLQARLEEQTQTLTDFREFASRGEQRAYEKALRDLQAKREIAVEHADKEAFNAAEAEIAELNKGAPKAPPAKSNGNGAVVESEAAKNPAIMGWLAENPWFNSDPDLNKFARHHDAYLAESKPGMAIADRLALVRKKTMAEFPDKFENSAREAPSTVSMPSGGGSPKPKKHSYEALPPEAKKACDKFVRSIPGFTRDEYVKTYAWEDQ